MLTTFYRKTQTAVEYCWRFKSAHPDFHVFWIYAGSVSRFDADYRRVAKKLALPCHAARANTDMRDGVKDWLNENDKWLMVVDNADCYNNFFAAAEDEVEDTVQAALPWPRSCTAMVIYTSRHDRVGARLTDNDCLPLEVMSESDGIAMFRSKFPHASSDQEVSRLLVALDHLPLSIAHAVAYLKFTKITIDAYLSRLETSDDGLVEILDQDVEIGRRDSNAPKSVVKAFQVSFDLVHRLNRPAANLFCLMACLDRNNISKNIISFACDPQLPRLTTHHSQLSRLTTHHSRLPTLTAYHIKVELPKSQGEIWTAIGEILSLALISHRVEPNEFTMHRHVQAITIRRLRDELNLLAFCSLTMEAISSLFIARERQIDDVVFAQLDAG